MLKISHKIIKNFIIIFFKNNMFAVSCEDEKGNVLCTQNKVFFNLFSISKKGLLNFK